MESLDLDITNYSIRDLEKFFQLKPGVKYTQSDIELKEYNIRNTLLTTGHINKRFKQSLISFLDKAKLWLITVKCDVKTAPTAIPTNYKLDTLDDPISINAANRQNELITRPDTQFVYANNSNFFPGKLNQLDTRVVTKYLNVDTRFRDNFYTTHSSDFILQLPTKFNKVVSMHLTTLELPISFYGISSYYGNHFLYLSVSYTDPDGNVLLSEKVLIVPDGNYNAADLLTTLNTLLVTDSTTGNTVTQDDIYSHIEITLDVNENSSGTGKVTIQPTSSVLGNRITNIMMDFTKDINGMVDNVDVSTKIGWNLGFIKPLYTGSRVVVSDSIVDPASMRYMFLSIDDFSNSSHNHFINVFNNSIMNPHIIARITLKGSYFTLLMENEYKIVAEPRIYFGPVDIQRLRIRLFDDRGRLLNLNNTNYSFCLEFKMLYDL